MANTKSFEEMIIELEEIVNLLEQGDAPLTESVSLFEKGVKLSAKCHNMLTKAEQKVKILTESEDGSVSEVEFNCREVE